MVEYSFDRDDFENRDPRDLFEREDFRLDELEEMRRDAERADREAMQREREQMERDRKRYTPKELEQLYKASAVLGATLGGGPVSGATMAAFLKTPIGKGIIRRKVEDTYAGASKKRLSKGRQTIRRSGQFSRANLLMGINPKKPRKKNKKHCKNLSQCLRQANAELRTKKGKLRKGKTQADVMRRAQRLLRKMK